MTLNLGSGCLIAQIFVLKSTPPQRSTIIRYTYNLYTNTIYSAKHNLFRFFGAHVFRRQNQVWFVISQSFGSKYSNCFVCPLNGTCLHGPGRSTPSPKKPRHTSPNDTLPIGRGVISGLETISDCSKPSGTGTSEVEAIPFESPSSSKASTPREYGSHTDSEDRDVWSTPGFLSEWWKDFGSAIQEEGLEGRNQGGLSGIIVKPVSHKRPVSTKVPVPRGMFC